MTTNYVMVDYENVQPKNLELLAKNSFKVYLFVGGNQTKLNFDLANTMQKMGQDAQYIKISGNGPNALDFHISYYIGKFSTEDPKAQFHIISRDKGFDPLVKHLKSRGIRILRENDIGEMPAFRVSASLTDTEKIKAVVKNLKARGQSKPRKTSTLANTINSIFVEKLAEKELMAFIEQLELQGYISVTDGKITYSLG